ncbi:MAG: extracellular solute-binding protein [Propionibacteriaceae bacterium]|jgi:multiple sugar transport system substrate-binding protein/raffinose/stachyose/melibiose transport system substrate-binding protein|nr:extracellular solute-binding protein [Propionibacteriaceae bacterium]
MKLNRRFLSLVALATAAPLALAACSTTDTGSAASSSAPAAATSEAAPPAASAVELTFLTFETPANDSTFWDAAIAAASAEVPGVTINRIVAPGDRTTYAQQLQASGQFPDLLASITPRVFLDAGLLEPFDEAWLQETFLKPDANQLEGVTYQPPTNTQIIPLVFYNKQIFADLGLEEPTTWAEFMDIIAAVRAAGITPLENAGAEPWSASMTLVGLASVDVLGQDPLWIQKRAAGEVKFADANFQAAVQKAVDLVNAQAYDPAALSVDYATANANFLAGKSAMYPMGSWFIGQGYLTTEQAANIGIFPWPSDDGTVYLPTTTGGTMSVSSSAKDVTLAMEWAKAFTETPGNFKALIEGDGAFPMFKKLSLADYNVTVTPLYEEGYTLVTGDDAQVGTFGWATNDDSLAAGMNDAFYALSQAVFSNSDVAALCADLDNQWDAAA